VSNRWRHGVLIIVLPVMGIWRFAVKSYAIFSSKITSEFICKFEWFHLLLVGDVFYSGYMLNILNFFINLQSEPWGNVKVVQPTVNYFVRTHCILTECAIEMIQVTTNTSFITLLLKQILLILLYKYNSSRVLLGFILIIGCFYWTC
jgi:hypothetical protein